MARLATKCEVLAAGVAAKLGADVTELDLMSAYVAVQLDGNTTLHDTDELRDWREVAQ
jgi:hypothetical protein